MIRMIVVWPVCDDDIRVPLPDEPCDHAPVLERRQDFAIMDVQHFGGYAETAAYFHHLFRAALRQRAAGHLPVTDVAVGRRNQLDVVPGLGPLHGYTGS